MGSPGAAAVSRPPTVPWIRQSGWETFYSAWDVAANYMMVHEHYLDFSYAPILHAADIPESIRSMPAFSEVEVTETTVSYTRVLPPARPTDWEAEAGGLDRTVDYRRREMGTFASPALHLQRWDVETASRRGLVHHPYPRHHPPDGDIDTRRHGGVPQLCARRGGCHRPTKGVPRRRRKA